VRWWREKRRRGKKSGGLASGRLQSEMGVDRGKGRMRRDGVGGERIARGSYSGGLVIVAFGQCPVVR